MHKHRPPRERRPAGRTTLTLLAPVLRYSQGRDAYVLRGVGNRYGPVLVPAERDVKVQTGRLQ
ncbi:MAG TPA: hypothetical protein VF533_01250 [Solirubrobacteraceae bacterium]|jgi:hypothetical protein